MVTILTNDNFEETLKDGNWVVDAWKSGCGYCDEYEPIFDSVASKMNGDSGIKFARIKADDARDFRMKYLKFNVGENAGSPATIFIESGEMKRRKAGKMDADNLSRFVKGEETKEAPQQKNIKDMTIIELQAAAYQLSKQAQFIQGQYDVIEQEIARRQK